jgi:hypothetical protein
MSTSGVSTWSLQRDSVINGALRKLSVLSGGSSAQAWEITNAAEALNAMIKGFYVDGMPIWAIKEYTFTTTAGTASYNIGNGQTLATPMPLKVIQGYRIESTGASNIPLNVYNHYDYNLLPVNATSGEPVNLFYQPFSTYGTVKLWPTPIDATTTITIVYQRPFEDMVISTDDFDFPSYWTEALIYGLAWRLAGEYGTPIMDRQNLQKEAEFFHQQALSFGTEEGSMYFMPDSSGRK